MKTFTSSLRTALAALLAATLLASAARAVTPPLTGYYSGLMVIQQEMITTPPLAAKGSVRLKGLVTDNIAIALLAPPVPGKIDPEFNRLHSFVFGSDQFAYRRDDNSLHWLQATNIKRTPTSLSFRATFTEGAWKTTITVSMVRVKGLP